MGVSKKLTRLRSLDLARITRKIPRKPPHLTQGGRVLCAALVAAAAVFVVFTVDSHRQRANQIALSLRWTRQMVMQAESLALAADARGEADPLGWASHLLSQGTDSRIIFASKVQVPLPVRKPEFYSLDLDTGIFDYTKVFDLQEGSGVRIRLFTARTGLFGAKTLLQHDLSVTGLFFLIYGFLYFFWAVPRSGTRASSVPAPKAAPKAATEPALYEHRPEFNPLAEVISAWGAEARQSLTGMSAHVREVVRASQVLVASSRASREQVVSLRDKLHQRISMLHQARRTSANTASLSDLASEVEIMIDLGEEPEMTDLLKRLLSAAIKQAEILAVAEVELEPVVTDADLALRSFEGIEAVTERLAAEIPQATRSILEQSRKIGELLERKSGA